MLLLRQEDAEAHVSYFDGAISLTEDVVTLDVSVQNIVLVHALQTQCCLVKTPLAKVFGDIPILFENNLRHLTTIHELKENPQPILKVVNFFALDELVTVQVLNQTALVDDVLPL